MKPHPYRNSRPERTSRSAPIENRSVRDRGMHAVNARPPPAAPYRRYPSLSDDGQPYFPRLRRVRRNADEAVPANETDSPPLFSVRAFALLAIVAIIIALAARG